MNAGSNVDDYYYYCYDYIVGAYTYKFSRISIWNSSGKSSNVKGSISLTCNTSKSRWSLARIKAVLGKF